MDELVERFGNPQLATLVSQPPEGPGWVYELKFDGYRILAMKAGRAVRLMSRRRQDWTAEFDAVARDVAKLSGDDFVIDGEACALDESGTPSFQLLQNRSARATRLAYFAFDLLFEHGEDLRSLPLEERRERLSELIEASAKSRIVLSKSVEGDPARVLEAAREAGLEGIIAKQKASRYLGGRAKTWLKIKCTNRQEFAIVGWLPLLKSRALVGSLVLGLMQEDGRFHFAGKVGTGFDAKMRKELVDLLTRDASATPQAVDLPRFGGLVHFVTAKHVAEVQFTEWTAAGHVRHPSFQGLRRDKKPEDCRREKAAPQPRSTVENPPPPRKASLNRPAVAGVGISHADRILDPAGVSKMSLARYYEAVGPWMLPHAAGRPLSLLRWAPGKPDEKGGVFLRHARAWGPPELRRVSIQEKTKKGEYLVVETVAGLVALAQLDILEIHTWNSRVDDLERPDRLVFDLDPGPDVPWASVVDAAREIRARLRDVRLESWPKSTGGKGLHIVVPLVPSGSWAACLTFARGFAQQLAADEPKRFVATMSKAARQGRIFVDYLRNNRTGTSVEAYSMRARPGAPVSLPLAWEELKGSPPAGGLEATLDRLRSGGAEAWAGYWKAIQMLPQ